MKRFRVCLSGLALGAACLISSVANAQPAPVPPLPPGVVVQQPMVMCPNMTQNDVCTALNNALHPQIVVTPPPPRDDRAERERQRAARQATCIQEAGDDQVARCRCQGLNLGSNGRCLTALGMIGQRVTDLEHRVDAIEARLGMAGGSAPAPTVAPAPPVAPPPPPASPEERPTGRRNRGRRHH